MSAIVRVVAATRIDTVETAAPEDVGTRLRLRETTDNRIGWPMCSAAGSTNHPQQQVSSATWSQLICMFGSAELGDIYLYVFYLCILFIVAIIFFIYLPASLVLLTCEVGRSRSALVRTKLPTLSSTIPIFSISSATSSVRIWGVVPDTNVTRISLRRNFLLGETRTAITNTLSSESRFRI